MSDVATESTVSSPLIANAFVQALEMALLGDETQGAWYNGALFALENVNAERASRYQPGRSSVLQHAEHTRYCLEMTNHWLAGENPESDWAAAWKLEQINEADWQSLKADLKAQFERWLETARTRSAWSERGLGLMMNNLAHTAYHASAIRQLLKETSQ